MSLISTSQLAALSKLVKHGMETDVTIYDHVVETTADGSQDTWVARSESVKCWVYTTAQLSLATQLGLQAVPNQLRAFFELGTDIESGDRMEIAGQMYTVIDTTKENTIQAMLTVVFRSMA